MALRCLVALVVAMPLFAQSSAEVNAGIQFNFASPGARSLARGGAFIADASDATAAYANPAGLVNLPAAEVSIELRASEYTHTFTDRGHAFGPPSNYLDDTIDGLRSATSTSRVNNVAFASFVVPIGRIALAAYRHELANFAATASTQGAFYTQFENDHPSIGRHYPAQSAMRLRIVGLGLAAGARIGSRLSIGVGIRRYDSGADSSTQRFRSQLGYGPPDYETLDNTQTQRGSGESFGVNAGLLLDLTRRFSIGASYRQGFSFPVRVEYLQHTDTVVSPPIGSDDRAANTRFHVPSFYGIGMSLRPTANTSIALDVNRITYSDLARDFVLLFEEEPRYSAPDGTEVRVGAEVILTRDRVPRLPFPLALSIGGWRDPDHTIRVSDATDTQRILFRPGSDDTHVSFGIGMLFDTHAQVHAAIDKSSRQTVFSISMMARFRR